MGVEDNTGTDTRTETTDKPTSRDRPYTPPPDNPGSPGQPSRRESIARARQAQMENGSPQPSQGTDTSPKPPQERDDKPASPQIGSQNEKAETSREPEAEDEEHDRDDGRPETGQGGRRDGREQQPHSQDDRTPADGKADTGTSGDRDRPQTTSTDQGTDTRTETADKPTSSERQWTPPPDNPGSPGQPSRRESIARAREAQLENASRQTEGTDTSSEPLQDRDDQPASAQSQDDGVSTPAAGKAEAAGGEHEADRPEADEGGPESGEATRQDETGAQTHPRDAGTPANSTIGTDVPGDPAADEPETRERPAEPARDPEQNPQIADGPPDGGHPTRPESAEQPASPGNDTATGAQDGEPGDRHTTDNTPAAPQEADQAPGTPELHGDQDDDRDRKAEEPESSEPADQNNPPDRDTGQSGETEEPGRELAPNEANTTEIEEEPRRFQGHITIPVDSDGRPIPPSRDNGNDTPDHDEPRRPEDDPASRDLAESDPERRSRSRDFYRSFLAKADDTRSAADKFAEPAQNKLERVQPTGQLAGARNNYDQIKPVDQQIKSGNALVGAVGAVIVLSEAGRFGIKMMRKVRGSEDARNR
ncbi:hypothetical protein [Spirillospora sp. NPDC077959]|uniref:hypothetical protein n=1 Tax=Spirillospora sp. NPDC077959 TaxID=3364529 RepID=UPI0037D92497